MESEDEKLVTFMEISGCNDFSTAKQYLEFAGGELSAALTLFMESGGGNQSSRNNNNDVEYLGENTRHAAVANNSNVRNPIPVMRDTLVGNHTHYGTMTDPLRNVLQEAEALRAGDQIWEKNDRLAALFEPPFDLMFTGTFEMAREKARKKGKWLIVTIHEPSNFQCQVLNRDLWKSDEVKEIIKKNFIFCQFASQSSEGQNHSTFYTVSGLPYIAIVDPLTGERCKMWNNPVTVEEFIFEALDFLSNPHGSQQQTHQKGKEKSFDMLTEEEQLELAIAASINGSSIKQQYQNEIPTDPKTCIEIINPVFNSIKIDESKEPDGPPSEVTRVQIRFPDGQRAVRKLLLNSKVSQLFGYLKAAFPEKCKEPFDLMHFRESLIHKLDETVEKAGIKGSSLTLDYI